MWSGVDNLSKYGRVAKSYDDSPATGSWRETAGTSDLLTRLASECDHFIAGAAMIGGISYFHTYAYDLLATNERIIAASCDAAIAAHNAGSLEKVTFLSSSMVFESTDEWPSLRRPGTPDSSAPVLIRISEACRRVLRPGGQRPVWPSLHPRPALQLRRYRREPCPRTMSRSCQETSSWR